MIMLCAPKWDWISQFELGNAADGMPCSKKKLRMLPVALCVSVKALTKMAVSNWLPGDVTVLGAPPLLGQNHTRILSVVRSIA